MLKSGAVAADANARPDAFMRSSDLAASGDTAA